MSDVNPYEKVMKAGYLLALMRFRTLAVSAGTRECSFVDLAIIYFLELFDDIEIVPTKLARQFDIHLTTLCGWLEHYKKNEWIIYEGRSQPIKITDVGRKLLSNSFRSEAGFLKMVLEEVPSEDMTKLIQIVEKISPLLEKSFRDSVL
jgi:hypothetical protein